MENVQQARELYGLIHARFLTTGKGLALLREKYLNGVYGHCQRILCNKQILLPIGLSEDLKYSRVKVINIFLKL
jgi:casein kinase II subunit beta